jgi:hypothetical protein
LQGYINEAVTLALAKIHLPFFRFSFKESKAKLAFQKTSMRKRREVKKYMSLIDDTDVVSTYTLDQAIADGFLVEVFKNRWQELSGGKPIVAIANIFNEISLAGLLEIWNEFVQWRKAVMPTLPEQDQLFHATMNEKKVWVIEDGAAFTLMYPEDY